MTDIGAPDVTIGTESSTDNAPVGEGATPPAPTESTGPKINPAWNSLLEKLPGGLHNLVIPELQAWDKNFQEKTSEVQSRYSPYQSLLDNGIPPERIETALGIASMLEQDPRKFYDEIGKYYEKEWGQGQAGQQEQEDETFTLGDDTEFDITKHPKFQELAQNQQVMTEFLAKQIEQERTAAAEAQIDQEVKDLTAKYGEFDEEWVFSLATAKEMPLEDAVKSYVEFVNKIKTTPRAGDSAPAVFTPSGGVPISAPDPAKMSRKDTRSLVVQLLEAQNKDQ